MLLALEARPLTLQFLSGALLLLTQVALPEVHETAVLAPWQVDGALAALGDRDLEVRVLALRYLGERLPPLRTAPVMEFLRQENITPRERAFATLSAAASHDPASDSFLLEQVLRVLRSDDVDTESELVAFSALDSIAPRIPRFDDLAPLLRSRATRERLAALKVLRLHPPWIAKYIEDVVRLTADEKPAVSGAACAALSALGGGLALHTDVLAQALAQNPATQSCISVHLVDACGFPGADLKPIVDILGLPRETYSQTQKSALSAARNASQALVPFADSLLSLGLDSPDRGFEFSILVLISALDPPPPTLIHELSRGLRSPDPNRRETSLRCMLEMSVPLAHDLDRILELAGRGGEESALAVELLGKPELDRPSHVSLLIESLHSTSRVEANAARRALVQIIGRSNEHVPVIVPLLTDGPQFTQDAAFEILSAARQLEADHLDAVKMLLRDDEVMTRMNALSLLPRFGDFASAAIHEVRTNLLHDNSTVREAAVLALASLDVPATTIVKELQPMLADDSYAVVLAALEGLSGISSGAAVPWEPLLALVTHPEPAIVAAAIPLACESYDHVEDPVGALRLTLSGTDPSLRLGAARVIAQRGRFSRQSLPDLLPLLVDSNSDVAQAARSCLARGLVSPSFDPKWLRSEFTRSARPLQYAILEIVTSSNEVKRQIGPVLGPLLSVAEASEERDFLRDLAGFNRLSSVQRAELERHLRLEDDSSRLGAAGVLAAYAELRDEDAAQLLRRGDPEGEDRCAILDVLRIAPPLVARMTEQLLPMLDSDDEWIRECTLNTLATASTLSRTCSERVAKMLTDEDFAVCEAALECLLAHPASAAPQLGDLIEFLQNDDTFDSEDMLRAATVIAPHCDVDAVSKACSLLVTGMSRGNLWWELLPAMARTDRVDPDSFWGAIDDPNWFHGLWDARGDNYWDDGNPFSTYGAPQSNDPWMDHEAERFRYWFEEWALGPEPHAADLPLFFLGPVSEVRSLIPMLSIFHEATIPGRDLEHLAPLFRFHAYVLSAGSPELCSVLEWLNAGDFRPPATLVRKDAVELLESLETMWGSSKGYPGLRRGVLERIDELASLKRSQWESQDYKLLTRVSELLRSVEDGGAMGATDVIEKLDLAARSIQPPEPGPPWGRYVSILIGTHLLMWIGLLTYYPRSRKVQALFFWNKTVRRALGAGYVNLGLTYVPLLRSALFAPFKRYLLEDAYLEEFSPGSYHRPRVRDSLGREHPIDEVIPRIDGIILLEGESGLGKTIFTQYLLSGSQDLCVFLRAQECGGGVLSAIAQKLKGVAKDEEYLRTLLHVGALRVVVDGVNEVSPETRDAIRSFLKSTSGANVLLTSQPIKIQLPKLTKRFRLLPLESYKISEFLISRWGSVCEAGADEEAYRNRCNEFVQRELKTTEFELEADVDEKRRILSNPMDLSTVAQLIARGIEPDLRRIQEELIEVACRDYKDRNEQREFPLHQFSELAYDMRCRVQRAIPEEGFLPELKCLEENRLVYSRQFRNETGETVRQRYFRHDKISDYFVMHSFLGSENDRPRRHIGQPQFRTVYLLLASLLPGALANELLRQVLVHAASNNDHSLSDDFVQILQSRGNLLPRDEDHSPEVE